MNTDPNANRETWLNQLAAMMAPRFAELGHALPPFRVAVGFPSSGKGGNAIGECWNKTTSADEHFEIFIRPDCDSSMDIAATLAHELTHAAVGFECGHKGAFATVVLALGLRRPLTATTAGPEFIKYAQPFLDELGPIPHAALRWQNKRQPTGPRVGRGAAGVAPEAGDDEPGDAPSTAPKPQTGRLLKASCEGCGYTVRVTAKWLAVGPPHCPEHGAMTADA